MESVVEEPSCSSDGKIGPKLAPFNPTNIEAIHMALKLLNINSDDVLYDIGCGDGRCLVEVVLTWEFLSLFFIYLLIGMQDKRWN